MDRQIQHQKLVKLHINQSKTDLVNIYGRPCKDSDNEIWFYRKYPWGIFKDQITFIFEENRISDVTFTEYILWNKYRNTFYNEKQNPEYKVLNIKS